MNSSEDQNQAVQDFFYMTVPDYNSASCSDNSCPCGLQGVEIQRNQGYLYISEEVVKMRKDCRSWQEFVKKATRIGEEMQRRSEFNLSVNLGRLGSPLLVCEQGARKRDLDLAVAAEDAKRWWESGKVPLRPTPKKSKEN